MQNGSQSSFFSRYSRNGYLGSDSSPHIGSSFEAKQNGNNQNKLENQLLSNPELLVINRSYSNNFTQELSDKINEEFLVCKICLENFITPKCLTCLHTFCQACIESHISAEVCYNKVTDYHHFTCPLCRKRTTLPIGGVKKLPDNFFVSGLSEVLTQAQRSAVHNSKTNIPFANLTGTGGHSHRQINETVSPKPDTNIGQIKIFEQGSCEICGQFENSIDRGRSETPLNNQTNLKTIQNRSQSTFNQPVQSASSKCLDCNKLLCDACVKKHNYIKVTKSHVIFKLNSVESIACNEHPEEHVRFYCEACSTCICILCTFNEHKEHELKSFAEAISKIRQDLQNTVNETQNFILQTRKWLSIVDDNNEFICKLKTQIREATDNAIDQLHSQEEKLIEKLHEHIGLPMVQAIEHIPEWECQISRLESAQIEVIDLLEGQNIDILLKKSNLKEKLFNLSHQDIPAPLITMDCAEIIFCPKPVYLGELTNAESLATTFQQNTITNHNPDEVKGSVPRLVYKSASTQTDNNPDLIKNQFKTNECVPPLTVRHRAVNTAHPLVQDEETNTRPRGVHVSITFGDDEQVKLMQTYLTTLQNIEDVNDNSTFAALDNLTRARVRRKLKERCNTLEAIELDTISNGSDEKTPTSSPVIYRQTSDTNMLS